MERDILFRRATLDEIVDLRHEILRSGLSRETAIFPGDQLPTTRHFAIFPKAGLSTAAVACASFHLNAWEGESAWQLRGMATASNLRGVGMGRTLLEFAEKQLLAEPGPVRLFWCNARWPAIGFYERMGWTVVSEQFEIPTAGPHVRMVRRIETRG